MPVVWDKSLGVGIPEFDEQHRAIQTRLRLLGDALGAGHADAAREALADVVAALQAHFEREERWMSTHAYPHQGSHLRAHQLGLATFERAARAFAEDGPGERFLELLERSARWLDIHLRAEDLRMGIFREAATRPAVSSGAR